MPILKVQEDIAGKVAAALLQIQAIKLNTEKPFTWASGWKSPIYCDNRLSLSYPDIRNAIRAGLVQAIRDNFSGVESIAGVATAGIAQGHWWPTHSTCHFFTYAPNRKITAWKTSSKARSRRARK